MATELLIARIEAGLDPGFAPISRRAWGRNWTPRAIDEPIGRRVMKLTASSRDEARAIVSRMTKPIAAFTDLPLAEPLLAGKRVGEAARRAGLIRSAAA